MRVCPVCSKPATDKFKPFCSARCADVDLHRWLSESYVVQTKVDAADESDMGDDALTKNHE